MSNVSSPIFANEHQLRDLISSPPHSFNRFPRNSEYSRSRSREYEKSSFKYSTMLDYEQNHLFAPKANRIECNEYINEGNPELNVKKKKTSRHGQGAKRRRRSRIRIRNKTHDQTLDTIPVDLLNTPFSLEHSKLQPLELDDGEDSEEGELDEELEEGEIRAGKIDSEHVSSLDTKPSYSEVRNLSGSENPNSKSLAEANGSKNYIINMFDQYTIEAKEIEPRQVMETEGFSQNHILSSHVSAPDFIQNHQETKTAHKPVLKMEHTPIVILDDDIPKKVQPKRTMQQNNREDIRKIMEADIDLLFSDEQLCSNSRTEYVEFVKQVESTEHKEYNESTEQLEYANDFENIEHHSYIEDAQPLEEMKENHIADTMLVEENDFKPTKGVIPLVQNYAISDPREKPSKVLTSKQKLNLVLDLDETILNSHTFSSDFNVQDIKNIASSHLTTIVNSQYKIVVVLRPYVLEFLKRISKLYNVYVYSHGRYEYVQNILSIIDKEERIVHREVIFKNYGQVCGNTPKLLSNLGLSPEEIKKTLILDDQRHIWEQDYHRVICAKKFIPLKEFIKEEKYNRYMLFVNKQEGNLNGPRWLTHNGNTSELHHYSESHVVGSKTCQLEGLAYFLEGLALDYMKENNNSSGIELLYEKKLKSILEGLKIAIIALTEARKIMFDELAFILGATIVDTKRAHYLLIDDHLEQSQEAEIQALMERKPLLTVLSIFWLTECFFCLNKVPNYKFQYHQ